MKVGFSSISGNPGPGAPTAMEIRVAGEREQAVLGLTAREGSEEMSRAARQIAGSLSRDIGDLPRECQEL
jgi:hypothetical protein